MRIGFFKGRFVITADNGMEEIGLAQMQGKVFSVDFVSRRVTQSGEQAGKLYFDEIIPCKECQLVVDSRYKK